MTGRARSQDGTPCRLVVIGASAGGPIALEAVLAPLVGKQHVPILIVQHVHKSDQGMFSSQLADRTGLRVHEAYDKQRIEAGHIYTAPANYHMLVEPDRSISLSVDARVNWSRPAIDPLFESAARACGDGLVAVILSGASSDGAAGIGTVSACGGLTIAQDPSEAAVPLMPESAIKTGAVARVMPVAEIGELLAALDCGTKTSGNGPSNAGGRLAGRHP